MIQTINTQRNLNSPFTSSLHELQNPYDKFKSGSEDDVTLSRDTRHWWNRCCIKKKLEESSQEFFRSVSPRKLSRGDMDDDKNVYDQAMRCLCFTCPKCLKALEKGRDAMATPTESAEVLEFLSNCSSGEDVALSKKMNCNS